MGVKSGAEAHRARTSANGPYSGELSKSLAYMPRPVREFVIEAGGMASLLLRVVWSAVAHPRGYWSDTVDHLHTTIRKSWFPVVVAVLGFSMFMALLTTVFFQMVGAEQLTGPTLFVYMLRNFSMWTISMVSAGVVGAAITADIGSRKVREELDAMQVLGIDPVRELAVPRVVSVALFTAILTIPAAYMTLFSLQLGTLYVAGLHPADFYEGTFGSVLPVDLISLVINGLLVGLLIGTICCYKGFAASGGSMGLGKAVNQAVVICFVAIFVFLIGYQAVLIAFFPEYGFQL
ncbi:phospholipid/cholesterol/gamma-HCH transport system permease protein [Haloechinothrix alba]|uniref:Phospholipid/cholesterol/gamma-HCH transport system permease protein n=1 Tax=Haloechinothrix alba TaxID=664784 RepID=A0A239A9W1_9PSEU|nr:ABC transporter permease [Haloechinothrix alba]SNR92425.1 phospholipid/cholesterol/gamma-HCH transport system permease protein [Haloechinothrix alba]